MTKLKPYVSIHRSNHEAVSLKLNFKTGFSHCTKIFTSRLSMSRLWLLTFVRALWSASAPALPALTGSSGRRPPVWPSRPSALPLLALKSSRTSDKQPEKKRQRHRLSSIRRNTMAALITCEDRLLQPVEMFIFPI